ncbi:MAG: hypothetical protein JSV57_05900 [Candidatus Bathyarchaeota archaeon]|nr:MAG: hypothetical protein JSV57_05900 [Candidatus Bathyarchaeota archaeon]
MDSEVRLWLECLAESDALRRFFERFMSEVVAEQEELTILKEHYESKVPDHCKEDAEHEWSSWEKYLKSQKCNCGFHKVAEA